MFALTVPPVMYAVSHQALLYLFLGFDVLLSLANPTKYVTSCSFLKGHILFLIFHTFSGIAIFDPFPMCYSYNCLASHMRRHS